MRSRLLVNGNLGLGLLKFDGDLRSRLVDCVIFPVGPKPVGDHLDAHLAIGNTVGFGLAVLMRLQFQAFLLLVAGFVQDVQYDFSVPDGLTVLFPDDREADARGGQLLGLIRVLR